MCPVFLFIYIIEIDHKSDKSDKNDVNVSKYIMRKNDENKTSLVYGIARDSWDSLFFDRGVHFGK